MQIKLVVAEGNYNTFNTAFLLDICMYTNNSKQVYGLMKLYNIYIYIYI